MDMSNGPVVLEQGWLPIEKAELQQLFNLLYNEHQSLKYGNVAEINDQEKFTPPLKAIYNKICDKLLPDFGSFDFDKLWLVNTQTENVDEHKLPYVPHVDYKRYLKVMIYVNDVSEHNGAFSALSCGPDKFESFRMGLSKSYKENQDNIISGYGLESYKKVIGKAGTVVVFDTNTPHFAGTVESGFQRKVLRFDFEKKHWNKMRWFRRFLGVQR